MSADLTAALDARVDHRLTLPTVGVLPAYCSALRRGSPRRRGLLDAWAVYAAMPERVTA